MFPQNAIIVNHNHSNWNMYFVVIILSHLKPFLVGLIKIFIDVIIEYYLFLLFVKFIKSIVEIILYYYYIH